MRAISTVIVMLLLVSIGAAGCETVTEHQKTAIGAGAGAAGGAVIGGLATRSTTGVVVGGLLGGLAGGAIGYYLERQDRTPAQAATATGYTPSDGHVVRIERVAVDPAKLHAGDTVNLAATYTVLTPDPGQTHVIRETREVRHNGALVANPTTEVTRADGTYTSALPITLPKTAAAGTYEVTTSVAIDDRVSRGFGTFTLD